MKIGFLGLGKLGLPVALAVESKGHQVMGTDINDLTLRNDRDWETSFCVGFAIQNRLHY